VDANASNTGAEESTDADAKYLYALAEIENTKKRLQRRAEESARALKRRLLLAFLPVLDNLERAVAHSDSDKLRAGLDATLRGFESALAREGVTPVETAGRPFDPNVAEAIGTGPADGVADQTVLTEAQRGYMVDGELLRPAHVVVAKSG
jgi:molecular chaperone GrpE